MILRRHVYAAMSNLLLCWLADPRGLRLRADGPPSRERIEHVRLQALAHV